MAPKRFRDVESSSSASESGDEGGLLSKMLACLRESYPVIMSKSIALLQCSCIRAMWVEHVSAWTT